MSNGGYTLCKKTWGGASLQILRHTYDRNPIKAYVNAVIIAVKAHLTEVYDIIWDGGMRNLQVN